MNKIKRDKGGMTSEKEQTERDKEKYNEMVFLMTRAGRVKSTGVLCSSCLGCILHV